MKIVFAKSKLMDALSPAMGTVCTKNTIPSIEGVLIETMEGNSVRLSTFEGEKKGAEIIANEIKALGIEPTLTRFDDFKMRTLLPSESKNHKIEIIFS